MKLKRSLFLFTTNKCNLSCRTCANKNIMDKYNKVKLNLDILTDFSYDVIYLTGGEPGLLPIVEKKNIITKIRNNYSGRIEILTNGTNINDWKFDNSLYFSIHITNENLEIIKNIKRSNRIRYIVVLNKDMNIYSLKDFIQNNLIYMINDEIEPLDTVDFFNICKNNNVVASMYDNENNSNACIRYNRSYIFNSSNKYVIAKVLSLKGKPVLETWMLLYEFEEVIKNE